MFQVSVSVPDIAPSAKTAVRGVDKYWGYRLVSRAFVMVLRWHVYLRKLAEALFPMQGRPDFLHLSDSRPFTRPPWTAGGERA